MEQRMRLLQFLVPFKIFSIAVLMAGAASSATIGNPDRGFEFAKQSCAGCHAIQPKQHLSPVAAATSFQKVSEVGGMTEMALRVFFRTPHKNMPNLIIAGEDQDNVIAYILSLQPKQ